MEETNTVLPTEQFKNTVRDEATLGTNRDRFAQQPGLADEDSPTWRPPETEPEPRPVEPILDESND